MTSDAVAIPSVALSVRQPWAWAIIYGGKPLENRSRFAVGHMGNLYRRVAVHSSKGMTKEEYVSAREFMASIGVKCPDPLDLPRGGVVGAVDLAGTVRSSTSPWFFGPVGIVLRNPSPCAFVPASGALGLFPWKPDPTVSAEPAHWMQKWGKDLKPDTAPTTGDLFAR